MLCVATFLALGLAAIAQAQDQCVAVAGSIPLCAVSAIESAAAGVGCGPTDFSCQCVPSNSLAINTAALSGVLKGCGAVTGLAVEASASAVCACAASATPAEASTTSSTSSTSSTPAVVASNAAPATTPAPPFSTTSTTASAPAVSPSAGTRSGSTTSSSAAQFTGAAVKAVASIGGCLGAFIAIMVTL